MRNGVIKSIAAGQGGQRTNKSGVVQDSDGRTEHNFVNQTFPTTLQDNSLVKYDVDSATGNAYNIQAR